MALRSERLKDWIWKNVIGIFIAICETKEQ